MCVRTVTNKRKEARHVAAREEGVPLETRDGRGALVLIVVSPPPDSGTPLRIPIATSTLYLTRTRPSPPSSVRGSPFPLPQDDNFDYWADDVPRAEALDGEGNLESWAGEADGNGAHALEQYPCTNHEEAPQHYDQYEQPHQGEAPPQEAYDGRPNGGDAAGRGGGHDGRGADRRYDESNARSERRRGGGGGYDDRRGYMPDDRRGGYDDRRGGYDDRRGFDDRRGGYDDRRGYYGRREYDDRRGYDDRR